MWVECGLERVAPERPVALTIGSFDGVHRGHQALIRQLVTQAQADGQEAVVLTFDPLPRQFFGGGRRVLLSSLEERLTYLEALGLDGVAILPFDATTAALSARAFVEPLVKRLHMATLWAGSDFALGRDREGDVVFLAELGRVLGFEVRTFAPFVWQGAPVRSTRIRQALQIGDVQLAAALLTRPYRITGTVIHGDGRGHQLSFPTANLAVSAERILPAHGIYAGLAYLPWGKFGMVANIGTRPTFGLTEITVEAHLLDFAADIYGQSLAVDFMVRLRPELTFGSAMTLAAQMQQDRDQAREWLAARALLTPALVPQRG
mgnify:CR=1 FL=1